MDQFTPSTPRVQLEQAKEVNKRISDRRIQRQEEEDAEEPIPGTEDKDVMLTPADTSVAGVDLEGLLSGEDSQVLEEAILPDSISTATDSVPSQVNPKSTAINVDRLRFETKGGWIQTIILLTPFLAFMDSNRQNL